MKSAAVGWSEMARYNKGGDKKSQVQKSRYFLDMLHDCGLGKEDTAAYTGASNTLLTFWHRSFTFKF